MASWNEYLTHVLNAIGEWESRFGTFPSHPSLDVAEERWQEALGHYTARLTDNYPFFHPRYAGQMLKPPHPAAVVGYLAAQLINPNNHALDGGPATGKMEKEVVRDLAAMFHLPGDTLGHLTSGGTVANLEALFIAREIHPNKAVAFSKAAHYTHGRMSGVLRMDHTAIPADLNGRMDLGALEKVLKTGTIGTVVASAGTTALGVVDPIADVVDLCKRHGVRVHVDAAYGGFFALHAWSEDSVLGDETRRHFRAIAEADSVVIDPHKHGLQPYGCGCVLFRDPSVGRYYKHDSPYTYFTSDDLHLGEISLECSRAGAAAGAFWFTTRLLPLRAREGLGPILSACLRAARAWHQRLAASDVLMPYRAPELDIVTYHPRFPEPRASAIDGASQRIFDAAMSDPDDPIFVSVLRVESEALEPSCPDVQVDQPYARILRSVLMKPEHEQYVDHVHNRLEAVTQQQTLTL